MLLKPTAKLLTPWRPQFTSEGVEDQIDHLSRTGTLLVQGELLRQLGDDVRVDGRVVVHSNLDDGDGGEVHALLPGWPGIGEAVVGIFLCQFTLAVLTDVGFLLRVRRAAADTVEWIVGWGEEEERWNRTWGLGKGVKKNASFTMLDITDPK
ncbi:hypothetical protein KC360_g188 [Hortaea werneckii]|nr:hypothetical protein KC360_g188 [Hortaea werneckii]